MSEHGRLQPFAPKGSGAASLAAPQMVTFYLDGQAVVGAKGEPVAMSLWALGLRILGWNEENGQGRGLFCSIGQCYECRMTIDGQRDQRACLVPVSAGLRVERQTKPGDLTLVDGMTRL